MPVDAEALRARLRPLGFDVVRFAAAGPAPGAPALTTWLSSGYQADLAWMDRSAEKRAQPEQVLPGARSWVILGVNYGDARPGAADATAPTWARYSLYRDYHDTLKPGLVAAGRVLEEVAGVGPQDYRYYVDTGPVLERGWAALAGLGFVGKNAMLISREFGNWLFLATILTRVELPADPPLLRAQPPSGADDDAAPGRLCGKCTRCLEACPTAALPAPGVVDARRCISYQTIENKGVIPRELRRGIGRRVYGCDVCAEVCPWNRFAQAASSILLEMRPAGARLGLPELLALTPERFAEVFRGTAIKRLKLRGLLRNACIVAGNTGDAALLPSLLPLARHAEPLVRAHAVWAVRQLGGEAALAAARAQETEPIVLEEYAAPPDAASLAAERPHPVRILGASPSDPH